jgi:hypothetical protein
MKNHLLLIILLSFFLITCIKKEDNPTIKENSSLVIKAGFMCGWGSGQDSLIISDLIIKYVYSVPANSQIPEINKTRRTTATEWNNILYSINLNNFLNLNYNSCNICVDGCDEWISIKNDSISHQIRFGLGFKIDSIKPLQDILSQLRSEFRK